MRGLPQNVLYVGTLPPYQGGSAISCAQLICGLAGRGHRIVAVSPITPETRALGESFAVQNPELNVTRFEVPYYDTLPYLPVPPAYRQTEFRQLSKILPQLVREQKFDLVVVGRETFANHVPDLMDGRGIPIVQWVRGNPAIAMINGTFPEDETARLLRKFGQASLVITVARHLEDGLREMGLSKVITIDNAIDLPSFRPGPKDVDLMQQLGIDQKDFMVLLPVNLHPRKRPFDLLESAKQALREEPRLVFVFLGDGPLRLQLKEFCRKERMFHRFRFLGWVDYPRIPEYYRLADVVVVPSQSEGLARVYMEALAARRLLICSDIPASREALVNAETALIYPAGDTAELTSALLQAVRNPELKERIALRGYQHSRHYDLERAVSDYENAFQRLLAVPSR